VSAVVADTQAVVWYLTEPGALSKAATEALDEALAALAAIWVASITLVELQYLIEKRRLGSEVRAAVLAEVEDERSVLRLAPLDLAVARALEGVKRELVPDMPDRIVTATAVALGVPLVSSDREIRASGHHVIW